ncbi:hypothetical protein THAOC_21328 [Thalassiosira oceanica]|uniref:HIRAN domain-containing protein n=1 Tax=Thalassiosira oceanica TaxID=159749 RepID=K0SJ76_THAOC|nr:hypothetical protein THAOC_21328 [Thalassiosira oceanica]|eukprot:EJK58532.1 hypothetical protein THAOC_21328 [Thalassiosira oceanica]
MLATPLIVVAALALSTSGGRRRSCRVQPSNSTPTAQLSEEMDRRTDLLLTIVGLKWARATAQSGEKVKLVREPGNAHDANAIKVVNSKGVSVGHISKEGAASLARKMDDTSAKLARIGIDFAVEGTITGCGDGHTQPVHVVFKQDGSNVALQDSKPAAIPAPKRMAKSGGACKTTLCLASFNISFAEPSQQASDRVSRRVTQTGLIRDAVLRCNPDVIALQESPSDAWGSGTFRNYVSIGTTLATHVDGHIDLLLRRELAQFSKRIDLSRLPGVAASISIPNGPKFAVCSVHLPHTAEGASMREMMCRSIMTCLAGRHENSIVMGDFNMRQKEDKKIEDLIGGWTDVWKSAGESKAKKFTWDSRTNRYHGSEAFEFCARFDRIYLRGSDLSARSFDLFANKPLDGNGADYISDHYGITAEVSVPSFVIPQPDADISGVTQCSASIKVRGDRLGEGTPASTRAVNGARPGHGIYVDLTGSDDEDELAHKPAAAEEMRRKRLARFGGDSPPSKRK